MRDRLIHTLRLALRQWCERGKPALEEALADAILAEFVVMDPAEHARMEAEVAAARLKKHIDECERVLREKTAHAWIIDQRIEGGEEL